MVLSPDGVLGVGCAKDNGATTTMTKPMTPVDSATVFDTAIIGSGIVGASVACFAAPHGRVLLLEAESAPGYHSTGRSAALYEPAYGPPQVRALTRTSRAFFDQPPPGFASSLLLTPRPAMFVGGPDDVETLRAVHRSLLDAKLPTEWLSTAEALRRVPVLRPEVCACAVVDGSSSDIDVHALLQGYLRQARAAGAQVVADARVAALARSGDGDAPGGVWRIDTQDGRRFHARQLVNAAGAWADEVAALAGAAPVGLQPCRRSAFLFEPPSGMDVQGWPAVMAADESWYIKPDAGLLLGSPANADPVHAHDVVAEELDVALGIHRIEAATTLQIRRPRSTWAGLRSFVPDGEPVCGFDPLVPGFFWAAALGGYGIQSSPGFGQLCAALLRGAEVPAALRAEGLDAAVLRPGGG
jgi:D-arginine dehydrogenase